LLNSEYPCAGNLVTNRTWEHFWLNEGFTVFVERKIIGQIYGKPLADFQAIEGLQVCPLPFPLPSRSLGAALPFAVPRPRLCRHIIFSSTSRPAGWRGLLPQLAPIHSCIQSLKLADPEFLAIFENQISSDRLSFVQMTAWHNRFS
jgi:hypothetical protein